MSRCASLFTRARAAGRRGSVVVIVMLTLLFATFALVVFMEKASVDLLVEQRESVTRRLRLEAYSALETTLAVLEEFREVGQGLRSPAEGWSDPLGFAGYEPSEGRVVTVAFDDESGKISLPRANAQILVNLFKNWGVIQAEAETLADALLGWMRRDHVYTYAVQPNYEQGPLPYEAPRRPLRSFQELAAIEKVRDFFYDTDGRPNEYWRRFTEAVSLLDFQKSNLNSARGDTLAAVGGFDAQQQQSLSDYLRGSGIYQYSGPGYFQNPADAQRVSGPAGDTGQFGTTISALRITITVRDGRTEVRMATVVGPQGSSAQPVQQIATSTRTDASKSAQKTPAQPNPAPAVQNPRAAGAAATGQGANARSLKYPFTILEIRENDEIPPAPAPPADSSLI